MRKLGRYTAIEVVASGSTSEIHLAAPDERAPLPPETRPLLAATHGLCALRTFKVRLLKDPAFAPLLTREAATACALRHPGAAALFEAGLAGSEPFAASELVVGPSLAAVLGRASAERRPLPREQVLYIALELAGTLGALHELSFGKERLLHGSLTPHNVALTKEGRVKLLGVGLSRARLLLPPSSARWCARAPELLEGSAPTPAADVYALGLLIHDALTQERLFRRGTPEETRAAILRGGVPRLKGRVEYVSDLLDELLAQMMARDPKDRIGSMDQVARALRSQIRASDEVLLGRLAELVHRAHGEELDLLEQKIDVARRRVGQVDLLANARTEEDALPALVESESPTAPQHLPPRPGPVADLLKASDLLADILDGLEPPPVAEPSRSISQPAARPTSQPAARPTSQPAARPTSQPAARPTSQAGARPQSRGPSNTPAPRKSSTASGAGPVAGAPQGGGPGVPGFEAVRELVRSGAARVFEARTAEGTPALLKVLDLTRLEDSRLSREDWLACFEHEVAIARNLTNPALPALLEAGEHGSLRYLAYGKVEGTPVSFYVGKALVGAQLRASFAQIARALHGLHEQRFVYANVQASTVLLKDGGGVCLPELSMMMAIGEVGHPLLLANLAALAPEFLAGEAYGPSAEQFALGALLYEVLTGTRPFRGLEDRAIIAAIREKEPRAPADLDPRIDAELSLLAMRMLAKRPEERFATLAAAAAALGG